MADWLAGIQVTYGERGNGLLRWGVWLGGSLLGLGIVAWIQPCLVVVVMAMAGLVAYRLNRPANVAFVDRIASVALVPTEAPPTLQHIARRIAVGDQQAYRSYLAHQDSTRRLEQHRLALERVEARRLDYHRAFLQRGMPIEDAQRIRGIGDGITASLRAAGIGNLADLLSRGTRGVAGIGPKRADLLATWASDRSGAIERLLSAGNFAGRAALDREYDQLRADDQARGLVVLEECRAHRASLLDWISQRADLERELEERRRRFG